jgi:hypothetical protein
VRVGRIARGFGCGYPQVSYPTGVGVKCGYKILHVVRVQVQDFTREHGYEYVVTPASAKNTKDYICSNDNN